MSVVSLASLAWAYLEERASVRDISRQFGISTPTVRRRLVSGKIKLRPRDAMRYCDERRTDRALRRAERERVFAAQMRGGPSAVDILASIIGALR